MDKYDKKENRGIQIFNYYDVISDKALKEALNKILKREINMPISKGDLEQFIMLQIVNKDIESLEGLQYAVNLKALDVSFNKISDLSPLENIPLVTFDAENNKIEDIEVLYNKRTLASINLRFNYIKDVSWLWEYSWERIISAKFASLGEQRIVLNPIQYKGDIPYVLNLAGIITDRQGEVPEVIKNITPINKGKYDSSSKSICWENIKVTDELKFFINEKNNDINLDLFSGEVLQPVYVYLKDLNLLAAVNNILTDIYGYKRGKSEMILGSDIKELPVVLNLSNQKIKDINGLQYFIGTKKIDLSKNNILDFTSMISLKNIEIDADEQYYELKVKKVNLGNDYILLLKDLNIGGSKKIITVNNNGIIFDGEEGVLWENIQHDFKAEIYISSEYINDLKTSIRIYQSIEVINIKKGINFFS